MAEFPPISKGQYLNLFLNISFLFLIFLCLTTHFYSSNSNFLNQFKTFPNAMTAPYHDSDTGCRQLHEYSDREAKCSYVKSHTGCQNGGYISYLQLFYCNFDPVLGYSALILWLLVLFYLLGNTAANYFCCSLEGLSRILKLSPNIAGVTLLSLGNGAPDLFASIVSFMGDETEKVGLNSILGGAFFVSSIVVGIISISVCHSRPSIERSSFIWDVTFFLLSLACLLVIIMLGKINLWGAISFFSLYFIYVLFISTSHLCHRKEGVGDDRAASGSPILPVTKNFLEYQTEGLCEVEEPLLGFVGDDKPISMEKSGLVQVGDDRKRRRRCLDLQPSTSSHLFVCRLLFFLELPLYLPRRLTIPVITAERWSKPFAVVSVTIAPVLVAVVWNSHGSKPSWLVYLIGASVGTISGVVAFFTTERSNPPTKWLFPWHAGGFLMSITWTYIAADELISLLVSLGLILGISPSILGLTVLAWGNSLGDLVSNVTMALNGGAEGAQVALSGCYAGPIFNTLIGLGLPLAFSAWSEYPARSDLPCDGDGVCMICRRKPSDDESITCKTCATPWHVTCLSVSPETLADALQWQVADALQWECPDCSPAVGERDPLEVSETAVAAGGSEGSGDLIAAIRAIESDGSLTEQEKAKRRQELLSGTVRSGSPEEGSPNKRKNGGRDVLDILDGSLNCSVCMQLLERPVTTPCGHNFCLKCFEKWIGQGKRTCANCRNEIPRKVASQPRINSALVVAIRMAKMSKSVTSVGTSKVYHFVHNQNRPDKAYTTERAKKAGKANACSGKIFVTVPPDHFGPILAENDPERNQGVLVGESWEDRLECRQWGAHLPHVAGIAGQSEVGAQSVALSGGYEDDEDHGEWFLYTGSGGRDLSGNKRTNKEQSFDQKFEKSNEALKVSCLKGYPVRVVRSHKEKRSSYAPETGVRYDGIYRIEKCWRKVGIQGFRVCRYLFVRCDNDPAPWTSDDHGDRPRPLPVIKELKNATDTSERKGTPSWDYDETEGRWMWKKPPPASRKQGDGGGTVVRKIQRHKQILSAKERLLNEFRCLICRNVMVLPLTTPCAHNFCKSCLEGAFSGQTFVRQRTCEGRRTLRAQKNVMKCPSCPNDISDFLQNPQVNRELMDVIVSLQRRTVESGEDAEEMSEGTDGMDEKPDAITCDKEIGESCEIQEDSEETDGMDEKPDAVAADKETGDESCEIQDDYQKDVSDPLVETKPEKGSKQKKVLPKKSDSVNGNAEVKSDTLNADAEVNAVKGETPENNELQTSPVDSTPKRNLKRRKPNGVSNSPSTLGYGVKTRSMKAKMAAAAPNDLPSITLQVQSDDDFE